MNRNSHVHAIQLEVEESTNEEPEPSPATAGHEVIREKEQLDENQPALGFNYKSFLESYSHYRQVERQFTRPAVPRSGGKPAAPARFK